MLTTDKNKNVKKKVTFIDFLLPFQIVKQIGTKKNERNFHLSKIDFHFGLKCKLIVITEYKLNTHRSPKQTV